MKEPRCSARTRAGSNDAQQSRLQLGLTTRTLPRSGFVLRPDPVGRFARTPAIQPIVAKSQKRTFPRSRQAADSLTAYSLLAKGSSLDQLWALRRHEEAEHTNRV